jgi:hypothetical protein
MVKEIAIFFGGIVLCFTMIQVTATPDETSTVGNDNVKEMLEAMDQKHKNEIKKLESRLSKKIETPVASKTVSSSAGLNEDQVKTLIAAAITEDRVKNPTAAADPEAIIEAIKENLNEETIKAVASNFGEIMAQRMKNRILKDIELTDGQSKELDVIWKDHQEGMRGIREIVEAQTTEDTSREERRELWRAEMTKLNETSDGKVKVVFNDDAKFEQYTKNKASSWGGGRGGR